MDADLAGFITLRDDDSEDLQAMEDARNPELDTMQMNLIKAWESLFDSETYSEIKARVDASKIGRDGCQCMMAKQFRRQRWTNG